MARPTKKANNRSASSRKKSKKSKLNIVDALRNSRVFVFVLIFAAIGAALVIRSFAQTDLPADANAIVAGYYNSKPTTISTDPATGQYTYTSYTSSQLVLTDGTLLCDDGNAEGTIATGKLPRGQTAVLQREIKDLGIDSVSDVVGDDSQTARVSNNEGFVLASRAKVKAIEVRNGVAKPDKLAKMQEKIQKACEKATDKVQRGSTPEFTIPTSSASNGQTVLNRLANAFAPKVSATPPPPTYNEPANATSQVTLTNDYRAARGFARLGRSSCMDAVAGLQAKRMAEKQTVYHNPNLLNEMYYVCYSEGLRGNNPPTAPPSNWSFIGENVGVGWGSDAVPVFNAYVDSPPHLANIKSPSNRIGSATYRDGGNRYWTAQVYAAW